MTKGYWQEFSCKHLTTMVGKKYYKNDNQPVKHAMVIKNITKMIINPLNMPW